MRKLLVALAVLVLLGLGLDQGARLFAESKLEDTAREKAGGAESASASIESFPFLGRLALSGEVRRVRVRVRKHLAGPLVAALVEVDLRGVEVDRRELLSRRVRLGGLDRGTVAVELDGPSLGDRLGLPVRVEGGRVRVQAGGVAVTARLGVDRGALVLRMAGIPTLRLPVLRSELVSCVATEVRVEGDRVRLSCEIDRVPPALRG